MEDFNKPSLFDRSVFYGALAIFAIFYVVLILTVMNR